ncbi:unannotated protein [freshwater metagenome]|uniref:Unannotated protein n=1 Tax=freshwater metagenome TaxID=449393 RepID=A0A6J6IA23_9ZZZZ|nr:methyltransferase domain-containing protein [Actinomycetota bacterium]MSZ41378.1 methyltransferase domain-containing protein [Actinomycetota bacterium]
MPEEIYVHPNERMNGTSVDRDGDLSTSFGQNADIYDAYRPNYASEAIDLIASRGHRMVLDVGCGTGILGKQLSMHGVSVLGVEPDERMASTARVNGLSVEVSRFEDWDSEGRLFDAVVSGQAWHWVDPSQGQEKLTRVLRPQGEVFLVWNIGSMQVGVMNSLDHIYREHGLEHLDAFSVILGRGETSRFESCFESLRADPAFKSVLKNEWVWRRDYSTDEWLMHLLTHPEHGALGAVERQSLFADLRTSIDELHAGKVQMEYKTLVIWAGMF